MQNEQYVSANKITSTYDLTSGTLRRWAEEGKIRCIRPSGTKRLYNLSDVTKLFGIKDVVKDKISVCYARVSSNHQKEDLERQVELLSKTYPSHKIYKDIGSGLNFNRPNFRALLDEIYKGNIREVVVTFKDRLCRFGFELLEFIFEKHGVKLLVLSTYNSKSDPSIELSEDLLAITTVFVAKNNGLRSAKFRKARNAEKAKEKS